MHLLRIVEKLVEDFLVQLVAVTRGSHQGDGRLERALAADRYRTIVNVYVLLRRPDGTILLLERSGTGYADGQLRPAGTWRQVNLWSRERFAKRARKQAS